MVVFADDVEEDNTVDEEEPVLLPAVVELDEVAGLVTPGELEDVEAELDAVGLDVAWLVVDEADADVVVVGWAEELDGCITGLVFVALVPAVAFDVVVVPNRGDVLDVGTVGVVVVGAAEDDFAVDGALVDVMCLAVIFEEVVWAADVEVEGWTAGVDDEPKVVVVVGWVIFAVENVVEEVLVVLVVDTTGGTTFGEPVSRSG